MSDDAQTIDTPQAVSLAALPVGELIMVETRNSQYRVVLTDPQDGRARIEGRPQCDWVLIDAGDIIVHVFRPEVREFYKIERMWAGERPADSQTH